MATFSSKFSVARGPTSRRERIGACPGATSVELRRSSWRVLVFAGAILCLGGVVRVTAADSTIHAVDRHAYAANLGWIDARANVADGVRVGEFFCSGYLYGANVGWINLGDGQPANGVAYGNQSAADFGVNRDAMGALTGLAWSANIGWLIFTNRTASGTVFDGPRVDLFTGRFSGHVFTPNAGWITLSNLFAHIRTETVAPGADTDGDGIPDAWELSHVSGLNQMTASSNLDADLATDREEYLADTHPLVKGDELRITQFLPPTEFTPAILTWTTRPTRVYRIEQLAGFDPGVIWEGSEWFPADVGGSTTRVLIEPPAEERYLRVGVRPPLGQ